MLEEARAHDPLLKARVNLLLATPADEDGIPVTVAALKECDIALICGGDGTVHLMAGLIIRNAPTVAMAVFPIGTGNDLARSLGPLPRNPLTFLQKLAAQPRTGSLDVWALNGELHFTNYVSFGFDAWILSLYQTALKHLDQTGFFGFNFAKKGLFALVGSWALLFHDKKAHMAGSAPVSLILSGIESYAGGSCIGGGQHNDGMIKMVTLTSKRDFLRLVASRFLKKLAPQAISRRTPLTLTFTAPPPVQVDGEDYSARFAGCRTFAIAHAGTLTVCA